MKGFRLGKPASSLYHLAVLHLLRGTTLHNSQGTEQKLPPKLCRVHHVVPMMPDPSEKEE
jgi:hypothetical protein